MDPTADLARLGGDEFTVLLPELRQSSDAAAVAQRITNALSRPLTLAGREIVITPSIGIALYPKDGDDPDSLMKHADMAMYFAKRQGKNRHRFFDAAYNEEATKRLTLEGELRKAIEKGELSVHYQPQLDFAAKCICESKRWHDGITRYSAPSPRTSSFQSQRRLD